MDGTVQTKEWHNEKLISSNATAWYQVVMVVALDQCERTFESDADRDQAPRHSCGRGAA